MNWPVIESELVFRTSRSSGSGGQHVNKTETKVELIFEPGVSAGLDDEEKKMVLEVLALRINKNGCITMRSQAAKSQLTNKELVIQRLHDLLVKSLQPVKKRKPTKPSKASKEQRLTTKKRVGEKKEIRKKPLPPV